METVYHIMSSPVISVTPIDTLARVRKLMLRYNITRVVVVDEDNRAIGIITQKDLVRAVFHDRLNLESSLAKDIMSKPVITIGLQSPVNKAAKIIVEKGISSLIVVDDDKKVIGIVTLTDLCKYFSQNLKGVKKVYEYMVTNVVTVTPLTSLSKLVDLMEQNNVDRVVVVEGKTPVGIVTVRDLVFVKVFAYKLKKKYLRKAVKPSLKIKMPLVMVAEDVMTPNPITISMQEDLALAAKIMLENGISGLPVVDDGSLVGIVTKRDIARALAEMA